jgi:hypothetical protein
VTEDEMAEIDSNSKASDAINKNFDLMQEAFDKNLEAANAVRF